MSDQSELFRKLNDEILDMIYNPFHDTGRCQRDDLEAAGYYDNLDPHDPDCADFGDWDEDALRGGDR